MHDLYLLLRLVHIVSGTVFFGTGLGIAFFMLMAHRTRNPAVIAHTARTVAIADMAFTATAVVVQPVTGLVLAALAGMFIGQRTRDRIEPVAFRRWFFIAMLAQFSSMHMQMLVNPWLVFDITGSYERVGAISLASAIPGLLLGFPGGVVGDRARALDELLGDLASLYIMDPALLFMTLTILILVALFPPLMLKIHVDIRRFPPLAGNEAFK